MAKKQTSGWIGSFCEGAALAAVCGLLAFICVLPFTIMINPSLTGASYWAEVWRGLVSDPCFAILPAVFRAGALFGVGVMAYAAFGRGKDDGEPSAPGD